LDIQPHYKSNRVIVCLKTSRRDLAIRSAKSIAQRLKDYWLSLRLAKIDIPALHLVREKPILPSQSSCMHLTEALDLYLRLKGVGKGKVFLPDLDDAKRRKPIPVENIRQIQQDCREADEEARWLVALISDTGLRLSEATGLHIDDIKLDCEIPYIDLKPHAWRTLKTKGSRRQIPLVGASLWAAKRVKANNTASPYAFPKYTSAKGTNANSASAAINK
jgi:integrase